jgi:hypothetical protein
MEQYSLQKESLDWNLAITRLMEKKNEKSEFLENFGLFEGDLSGSEDGSESGSGEDEAGEEEEEEEREAGEEEERKGTGIINFFPNLHRWKVGETPIVNTQRRIDIRRKSIKALDEDIGKELAGKLTMRVRSDLNKNFYTKKFLKFEILGNFR